jgi:hypothetical protein
MPIADFAQTSAPGRHGKLAVGNVGKKAANDRLTQPIEFQKYNRKLRIIGY